MKYHFFALLLFQIAFAVCAEEVRLPVAVAPLSGDILQREVWDFSNQWLKDDNARTIIRSYGDSLLTETFEGRRFWYSTRNDSLSFLGEEDRLTSIMLDSTAFVAPLPLDCSINNAGVAFEASGMGGGRQFGVFERGSLEFTSSGRTGVLIMSPGDTITDVLAVRERRFVTAVFPEDTIPGETYLITEICRWYDTFGAVSLLPVAVQRRIYNTSSLKAESVPIFSAAYLPETAEAGKSRQKDEIEPEEQSTDDSAIEAAIKDAVISFDGKTVSARFAMPQAGLTVALDVVDAAGRLYLHESILSSGSTDEIRIDCSGLRPGQYLAVIGVEDIPVAPQKKMIIIR